MKMARIFVKNERPSTVLILENNKLFVDIVMLKKMVRKSFLLTFALVTGRVPRMLIIIFVPIL